MKPLIALAAALSLAACGGELLHDDGPVGAGERSASSTSGLSRAEARGSMSVAELNAEHLPMRFFHSGRTLRVARKIRSGPFEIEVFSTLATDVKGVRLAWREPRREQSDYNPNSFRYLPGVALYAYRSSSNKLKLGAITTKGQQLQPRQLSSERTDETPAVSFHSDDERDAHFFVAYEGDRSDSLYGARGWLEFSSSRSSSIVDLRLHHAAKVPHVATRYGPDWACRVRSSGAFIFGFRGRRNTKTHYATSYACKGGWCRAWTTHSNARASVCRP